MRRRDYLLLLILSLIGSIFLLFDETITGKSSTSQTTEFTDLEEPERLVEPLGLPKMRWPDDNPYSKEKAELGRTLYFDKRLSTDGTISCATCHVTRLAFTDRKPIAIGIKQQTGSRHSPTVINAGYEKHLFWDGRANSLEEQVMGPLGNPKEMTLIHDVHEAHRQCQEHIQAIPGYRQLFKKVFGNEECRIEDIAKAIATFERTVLSGNSAYDRYMAGDKSAMTPEQIHGLAVFKKVGCANCHAGRLFTDGKFSNIGVGMDAENPDLGRYVITKKEDDWGAFKTPTLREVENTYPYMHNGSLQTLEEVVDYYDRGGTPNRNLHPLLRPLHLSEQDKKDLVSFMKALSGEGWQHFTEPQHFPE